MSTLSTATATTSAIVQPDRAGLSPRTMYFPPPPAYAAHPPSNTTAKNPASIPFTFAFKSQSQSRPSTSSSTSSTTTNNIILKPPPRPILKRSVNSTKRTRQWILLSLLLLSFTILILSTIFAYCAALPHSDNIADAQASEVAAQQGFQGPVTTTVSVRLVAATTAAAAPTASITGGSGQPQGDTYPTLRRSTLKTRRYQLLSSRDNPSIAVPSEMSQEDIDAALARDAQNQSRFSTTHAQVALTFYTATLPLLTMLHTAVELLISLVRPETSQNTKFGDLILLRNRVRGGATAAEDIMRRRRVGALLSFSVSILLVLGWTVMQLFTLNCEISTFGNGGEGVCPVQIRGHRMGGISELSVGKVCLGFAVVCAYAGYCWYLVRRIGVGKGGMGGVHGGNGNGAGRRMSSFKRRARFASGESVKGDGRGDVENVSVVGVEGGSGRGGTV